MRAIKTMIPLIAMLPSAAAATEVCDALDRIVRSSRETPAFGSLRQALDNGDPLMPGFGGRELCGVRPGVEIRCGTVHSRRTVFHNWGGIEACPGVRRVTPGTRRTAFRAA